MYFDYLLKFTDEAQAKSVLFTESKPNYDNIDIIGTILKPTGVVTVAEDGEEVPVMADVGGYHVNVRNYSEAPELNQYVVVTNNPVRVWA